MRKRFALYRKLGIKQPLRGKVFMIWISIVLLLMTFDMTFFHVMSIFVPGHQSDTVESMIYYMRYINYPIFQFISASTITYIFYYQAMELKRENQRKQEDIIGTLKPEEFLTEDSEDAEARFNSVTGLVNKSNYLNTTANQSQLQQITMKLLTQPPKEQ